MKAMHLNIRQIGNSHGVVIPKPLLAQLQLTVESGVELTVEGDSLVLRQPKRTLRKGWAEAAQRIATAGEDSLLMGEFANADDSEHTW